MRRPVHPRATAAIVVALFSALLVSIPSLGYVGSNPFIVTMSGPSGKVDCPTSVTISARVRDAKSGKPVDHQTVSWSLKGGSSGDRLSASQTTTNGSGVTGVGLSLGSSGGKRSVVATVGGFRNSLTVTCRASEPKPTPRPTPKPTPRPTPKPTARATARPTDAPTAKPAATEATPTEATASGGPSESGAPFVPTVYVIAPSLTDPFWITEQNGANQAGKDFGVNVIFQAPAQDTGDAGMATLAEAAVGAKPDGIAIDYTSKAMEAVTTEALDAGIPVVLYNNNRFEGDNAPADARIANLAFSGQDESVSGEILADHWASNLKTAGCNVLIVNPFPTAFVLTLRGDGVKRSLDRQGFTHTDLAATGDEGQNEGLIAGALQADPSICGIVGLGNPAANPAAKYVSENSLDIPIATFDVGQEAAEWIEKGVLTMAINQQPYLQSYYAVANLNNWLKYNLSPVNVNTGTSLVTKDNIATVKACIAAGHC